MRIRKQFPVILVLSVFFLLISPCLAIDRLVPSQYATIQAAINACNNGDTVIVSEGTYNEAVEVTVANLTIQGKGWGTIITQPLNSVSTIQCDAGTKLEDLCIINTGVGTGADTMCVEGNTYYHPNADHIRIDNCLLISVYGVGASFSNITDVKITNCRVVGSEYGLVFWSVLQGRLQALVENCIINTDNWTLCQSSAIFSCGANVNVFGCELKSHILAPDFLKEVITVSALHSGYIHVDNCKIDATSGNHTYAIGVRSHNASSGTKTRILVTNSIITCDVGTECWDIQATSGHPSYPLGELVVVGCQYNTAQAGGTIITDTENNIHTWHVAKTGLDTNGGHRFDDAFLTIAYAISQAAAGDTIIVHPGTYTGNSNKNLDYGGKAIMVRSTDPEDPCMVAATIIDCENSGRGFYFHSGETIKSVLSGFTIKNGRITDGSAKGGGIYCNGSSPRIENCIITNNNTIGSNEGKGCGGAIACESSNTKIVNCTINSNTTTGSDGVDVFLGASGGADGCGGGIYLGADSNATIENCAICNNTAKGGNGNDGNCVESWPGDGGNGLGGGIYTESLSSSIKNCTLYGNKSQGGSGGTNSCGSGLSGYGYGGGVCVSGGYVTVTDSIIWQNTADSGSSITGSATVSYSDIQGSWPGTGNINADPVFVTGPDGNYYLSQITAGQAVDSPCVDSGSDTAANLGMDKFTTRTDEIWDREIVDMGYHYPSVWSPDIDENFSVDAVDFSILANDWHLSSEPNDPNLLAGDLTIDRYVDFADLFILADAWLDCLIGPAGNPYPANGAIYVDPYVILGWSAGKGASEHDIFFGTDANAVSEADHTSAEFIDMVLYTNFDPCVLDVNTTYFWRIDEIGPAHTTKGDIWSFTTVYLPPPGAASNPIPADGATDISSTCDLSWTAGSGAHSHDVYFGTVNPPPLKGNQAGTTYDTGTMTYDTIYYWRIDEKNPGGTTTGTVWSFTTMHLPPPGAASNPSPADGATDVILTKNLGWTAGLDAISHDVYFGTANPPPFKGNQAGTTYDTGTMDINTPYYWRIDEKNASGTTTGTLWSFTTGTEPVDPNLISGWAFDETSGTIAYDSIGSNDGNVIGATWTSGQIDGALGFDGNNDYVRVPDSIILDFNTGDIAVSMWIKPADLGDGGILGKYDNFAEYNYAIWYEGGILYFEVGYSGATIVDPAQFEAVVSTMDVNTANQWYHIAGTYDHNYVRLYINGQEADNKSETRNLGEGTGPLCIGTVRYDGTTSHTFNETNDYFYGVIDDVRIYDRALSAAEIQDLYNEGLNP